MGSGPRILLFVQFITHASGARIVTSTLTTFLRSFSTYRTWDTNEYYISVDYGNLTSLSDCTLLCASVGGG